MTGRGRSRVSTTSRQWVDDAADLDLLQDGDGRYLFVPNGAGGVWSLRIVTVPTLEDPLVLDSALTAALYLGGARVLVDPYTGLSTNEVRIRTEYEALLHVRDIAGAYRIAASA